MNAAITAPVVAVLADHGRSTDTSKGTLNVRIQGRAATYEIGIFANGESEIVCSYTFVSTPVPTHRRAAVAEAMTRINTQIWLGNFEMNPDDGYMRFRMNADVEGIEPTRAAAERLVFTGTRAWDDHYDTLLGAIVTSAALKRHG